MQFKTMTYTRKRNSAIFILIALIAGLAGCSEDKLAGDMSLPATPVTLYTIVETEQSMERYPGKIEASLYSALSFRINGKLEEILVKPGDEVSTGQLIARLDDRDAQSNLEDVQSQYNVAAAMYERMRIAVERGAISRARFDEAEASYHSAKAALTRAKDQLSYTELIAPFAGIIATVPVENYQVITPKQTIAKLQKPGQIDVVFQLPEQKIRVIERPKAQPDTLEELAWVTFPDMPDKRYRAQYKDHESVAKQGSLSYEVTLTLPAPEEINLLDGMSATVLLDMAKILGRIESTWRLPYTAIVTQDGERSRTIVWRFKADTTNAKEGEIEAVPVTIRRSVSGGVIVEGNLALGDQIIAAGATLLSPDQRVQAWVKEGGL
jgi:RND family efflux transporter MFP subunit